MQRLDRVGVESLHRSLPRLLSLFAPWALVVLGRRVCLVAQRVPALVRLVGAVQRWRQDRRRAAAG